MLFNDNIIIRTFKFDHFIFTKLKICEKINAKLKMVWIETPTNPTLKLVDIAGVTALVRKLRQNDVYVVVDNTFLSPYFQVTFRYFSQVLSSTENAAIGRN